MNTSDRFLRFAAECEVMAKITHSQENKIVWKRMAQRWLHFAELIDQQYSNVHRRSSVKRRHATVHSLAH
jgi:hypothetical protein